MRPFEPGLCSVTFRSLTPDAVIDLAASNGMSAIEWGADVHVPPGDLANARAVNTRTTDAGLRISSYGSYIFAPDFTMQEINAVLDTTEVLGTTHIRIWPGSRKRPSVDYTAEERRMATDALAGIAEKAEERGMTIGLEYHPNSLTDNLASSLQLAKDLPFANVFFYWQPAPGLPLESALAEIQSIGSRICHLHVFAWLVDSSRLPFAERTDYWRTCLAALPQSDWKGTNYAMLEFVRNDDAAQFAQDAQALRRILTPSIDTLVSGGSRSDT